MRFVDRIRREDGAAAVEFALIVGVLAMLIFGMLQYGLAFFQLQNLRSATREGARVGAMGGSVDEMRAQVESQSRITGLGSSVVVKTRTGGTLSGAVTPTSARPCVVESGSPPDSVQTSIPLSSAPQSLQDIFTVDIPLMPTISLLNATVEGEFRCES
jgi:Flp pilus assembly protein TadG